jgi:hypothetical protein
MGDGRQATNREGGGRLTALRWQQNRQEEWIRLAEGREGAHSPKSVTRESFGRNKVKAFPKVLLEKFRSPRRGERGASGRETLCFLVSGEPGLRRNRR